MRQCFMAYLHSTTHWRRASLHFKHHLRPRTRNIPIAGSYYFITVHFMLFFLPPQCTKIRLLAGLRQLHAQRERCFLDVTGATRWFLTPPLSRGHISPQFSRPYDLTGLEMAYSSLEVGTPVAARGSVAPGQTFVLPPLLARGPS